VSVGWQFKREKLLRSANSAPAARSDIISKHMEHDKDKRGENGLDIIKHRNIATYHDQSVKGN
jgi:hypothetical protein